MLVLTPTQTNNNKGTNHNKLTSDPNLVKRSLEPRPDFTWDSKYYQHIGDPFNALEMIQNQSRETLFIIIL